MNRRPKLIAPSILSADFGKLGREVADVTAAGADIIHVDVMDGHFVPNLTIGPPVIEAVRAATELPLDTHLMVTNPTELVQAYIDAGSDWVSVHAEVCHHLHRALQQIRAGGARPGVVLNPHTPLSAVEYVLEEADYVLLMTVNPGFGGQAFIDAVVPKITRLREMIDRRGLDVLIEVDGGVKTRNIGLVRRAGADMFVAGSAIFGSADYDETIAAMKRELDRADGVEV